jgi:hypothetical protein
LPTLGAAPERGELSAAKPGCRARFLFGYFLFCASKEKVTRRKGEIGSGHAAMSASGALKIGATHNWYIAFLLAGVCLFGRQQLQGALRIGGHLGLAEVLRHILALDVRLGLVAVVRIKQHAALADRVDAQGMGRVGKVD